MEPKTNGDFRRGGGDELDRGGRWCVWRNERRPKERLGCFRSDHSHRAGALFSDERHPARRLSEISSHSPWPPATHQPSSSTAYDLDLQILLPPGLAYQPRLCRSRRLHSKKRLSAGTLLKSAWTGRMNGEMLWSPSASMPPARPSPDASPSPAPASPGAAGLVSACRSGGQRRRQRLPRRRGRGGHPANLTLTKAADPDPVEVGKTLTYTLTYRYRGDGPAHNAVICDELDPGG